MTTRAPLREKARLPKVEYINADDSSPGAAADDHGINFGRFPGLV